MTLRQNQTIALTLLTVIISLTLLSTATQAQPTSPQTQIPSETQTGYDPLTGEPLFSVIPAPSANSQTPLSGSFSGIPDKRPYRLGPNDTISIKFFDAPELNLQEARISPDGTIMLPALGNIDCNGLTLPGLQAYIQNNMRRYLKDPKVALNLNTTKPLTIQVYGGVRRAGSYEFNTNPSQQNLTPRAEVGFVKIERTSPTLANVLISAGGLEPYANLESVTIKNRFSGKTYNVNLLALVMGLEASPDVWLEYGDTVIVPTLDTSTMNPDVFKRLAKTTYFSDTMPVRVFGYVNTPGLIPLDTSRNITLNSAIAAAGGYQGEYAYSPKRVFITRFDRTGHLATFEVNPKQQDLVLLPNDVIYVPDRVLSKVARTFRVFGTVVSPISSVAGTYNGWAQVFDPTRNFR
jgi:polysaccharide biosynthesis/export protein